MSAEKADKLKEMNACLDKVLICNEHLMKKLVELEVINADCKTSLEKFETAEKRC